MTKRSKRAINSAASDVIQAYATAGKMIATAESCTGGMIAAALTDIAGSSDVFERGFVTYSNQAKVELLGVSVETLLEHGAVSQQTAAEMAIGAARHSGADIAVSVTGIAGPGGGTPEKPVGLVYLGFAGKDGAIIDLVELNHDPETDRETIRLETTWVALVKLEQIAGTLSSG
ncbi:MAG: CinA family protein [Rhizobiaceae bacterium]